MSIMDKFRLDGKKALVTGGGSGIGRAYAHAFAEAGADVAIVDYNYKNADKVSSEIKDIGTNSLAIKADCSKIGDIENMIKVIKKEWDRLDIAVNNAGISIRGNAEDFLIEDWDKVMDLNLRGSFLCAQQEAKIMIPQKYGKIIFTSSRSAVMVNKPQFQISYSVSKAGVEHLTRCLAVEWIPYGIYVNCISPGAVYTPALEADDLKPLVKIWEDQYPIKRLGNVEEFKGVAVFLASDASTFMVGEIMVIDGGLTLY